MLGQPQMVNYHRNNEMVVGILFTFKLTHLSMTAAHGIWELGVIDHGFMNYLDQM